MIAVRDLQIGDFINTENNGVVQITVLSWRGVGYEGGASTPEHCSYIPLTENILVKNGYKSTQGIDFYWLDDKKHCCIKNYDGKRLFCYKQGINDVWLVVKYVHQLQHLLRLCGIEKEIEL